MFKNKWSHKFTGGHLFSGRKSVNDRQYQTPPRHSPTSTKQDFLSNIVEEGSTEDIPKTFEQEEQYLNECLRSVGGSIEDVQCSEAEEYDFDDFNSIASTASILNLNSDLNDLDRLRMSSPPPSKSLRKSSAGPTRNGMPDQSKNGLSTLNSNDGLSNFQESITRVHNWNRLGRSGEQKDWKKVLLRAAEAGDFITVQDAVSHLGATRDSLVTTRDAAGNTPLHKAAQNGKLQCLKWLVKRAPQDAVTMGNHDDMTPAAMATQCGQCECLEWLVEETEASRELEKKNTFTLVHYAAKEGQEKCLKYLLSHLSKTSDISDISDSNGITPAHLAAREGHVECLQTLVDYNNDVTLTDKERFSPTDYAVKAGQTGCARYLVLVEACFKLSSRVKSLSQSLSHARHDNDELRDRVQLLESRSHMFMMDRPEAVGGDQSDSSSSSTIYSGPTVKPYDDTRRSSSAPDGESPKGTKKESTAYDLQVNGYLSPNPTLRRASLYDVDAQSKPRLSGKERRRGSHPATHANKNITDENNNFDGNFVRHDWSSLKQDNGGHEPSASRSPTRTPSCATISMTTSPVSHVTQRGNEANLLAFQEHSTNKARASRFLSPYIDRSRTSSDERALVTNSTEYHPRTPKRNGKEDKHIGSSVKKHFVRENGLSVARIENRTSFSSESPFSSDSDFEHTNERRHSNLDQTKKSRTERVNDSKDSRVKISSSTNQCSSLSLHGVEVGKNPAPQGHAHDYLGNNRSAHERQAQVTWGDPKIQRRFTIGSSALVENNGTYEQVLSHPTKSLYKQTKLRDIKQPYSSQFEKNEEKPWYETEEVEL